MKTMKNVILWSALCLTCVSQHARAENLQEPEFRNDVIPLLTKSGCNAGACHGAAIGRGGFKLSLYGSNPGADYDAIVRQLHGRRVNLASPQQSLILRKPTQAIEHEGGLRFDEDSAPAKLLTQWIRAGAQNQSARQLTRVEVTPRIQVIPTLEQSVDLVSTAFYSDGTQRDVTAWTIFAAEDPSAIAIESDGRARVLRRGRHIVVARYLDQVLPMELIVPLTNAKVDLSNQPKNNFIDEEILTTLSTLHLPVSPQIDDAAFARRVTLDLIGRLPDPKRLNAPIDRAKLIDELLQSEEFTQYWAMKLAQLLRLKSPNRDPEIEQQGLRTYHTWLAEQIRDSVGFNQIAQRLLTAEGDTREYGPANFYRTVDGPRKQAEFVSELFMGSRLRCANCHNHPLDRWTQDDYHGLAAIFAKVESGQVVKPKPSGEVIHPQSLEPAALRIPGERFLTSKETNGRQTLATWLTQKSNPYFSKAIVNRLWKNMMGRGLVEPVDDFRSTNPATHPKLLDELARDFQSNGYQLRHTLRQIATSAAYARSANANPQNKDDDRYYAHALRRGIEPEVLADAITDVLGLPETYGNEPNGTRAVALINSRTPSRTLDVLGRCDRQESCEASVPQTGGLPQMLHLFNGPLLNERIASQDSRLDQLIRSGKSPIEIMQAFYRLALGRELSEMELQHWQQQTKDLSTKAEQRSFLEDFVWGLLSSQDFRTNH